MDTELSEYSMVGTASRDLARMTRTGSMGMGEGAVTVWVERGETTCTSLVSRVVCWFDRTMNIYDQN